MKRACFTLAAILLLCSSATCALYTWPVATAKRLYNGTALELVDTATLHYPIFGPYEVLQLDTWNYDTAWHYNGMGAYTSRESRTTTVSGEITEMWNHIHTGTNWVPLTYWRYEYDAKGRIENIVWYDWGGAPDSMRTHYTRNTQGAVTEKLDQNWDAPNSQWVNAQRYTYSYNLNKEEIMMLREEWDIANSQWLNFMRIVSSWNGGNKTEQLTAQYVANNWEDDKKNVYTYNAKDELIADESFSWSGTTWDRFSNIGYTYDANGNELTAIHKSWDGTQYINLYRYGHEYHSNLTIIHKMTWDINTSTFVYKAGDEELREYYQSESAVQDVAGAQAAMSVYPIPARNYLRIQADVKNSNMARVNMIDINGRQVKTQAIPAIGGNVDAMINLAGIPAGVYTLSLQTAGSIVTRKVVVE